MYLKGEREIPDDLAVALGLTSELGGNEPPPPISSEEKRQPVGLLDDSNEVAPKPKTQPKRPKRKS